jgi:hypothetical protein
MVQLIAHKSAKIKDIANQLTPNDKSKAQLSNHVRYIRFTPRVGYLEAKNRKSKKMAKVTPLDGI